MKKGKRNSESMRPESLFLKKLSDNKGFLLFSEKVGAGLTSLYRKNTVINIVAVVFARRRNNVV